MLKDIVVEAEKRVEGGKNESRRMRRAGRVPAVLYGGKEEAIRLSVDPKSLEEILHSETGANTLFTLNLTPGGKLPGRVMIKDHSVHPVNDSYLHADFMRIAMDKAIRVQVAIHTVGLARGVKLQGGILDHPLREIEVECLPADIPERIDLDISELDLGKSLRVSDIKTSEGIKILTDPGMPVVSVVAPTIEKVAAPAAEGAAVVEAPAEPELIKKGKGETAEEPEAAGDKKGGEKKAPEKGAKPEKK